MAYEFGAYESGVNRGLKVFLYLFGIVELIISGLTVAVVHYFYIEDKAGILGGLKSDPHVQVLIMALVYMAVNALVAIITPARMTGPSIGYYVSWNWSALVTYIWLIFILTFPAKPTTHGPLGGSYMIIANIVIRLVYCILLTFAATKSGFKRKCC